MALLCDFDQSSNYENNIWLHQFSLFWLFSENIYILVCCNELDTVNSHKLLTKNIQDNFKIISAAKRENFD